MKYSDFRRHLLALRDDEPENWIVLRRTRSTNDVAARIIHEFVRDDEMPPDSLIVAWEQSAGKGRRGHRWLSPPGAGVYATLLLSLPLSTEPSTLPLLTGTALCEVLAPSIRSPLKLKWPNDLMIEGKKLGGILIEARSQMAIIGFGINHSWCEGEMAGLTTDGGAIATALDREGSPPELPELAVALVRAVWQRVTTEHSAVQVIDSYLSWSLHEPGEAMRCRVGEETLLGDFIGFDEVGRLRMMIGGVERSISSGEVIESS